MDSDAPTLVITTERSSPARREALTRRHVRVCVVPSGPAGVDLASALRALREEGIRSLLVEGGAQVITSLLDDGFVDRLVVGVSPVILGTGTEAVGPLGVSRVQDGIRLTNRSVHMTAEDILIGWDVTAAEPNSEP